VKYNDKVVISKQFNVFLFIGEPHISPPSSQKIVIPGFASLTCGQNITLPPSGISSVQFFCQVFNGSRPITTEVFKDDVSISNKFSITLTPFDNDDLGKYTFVASTERCGSTSAASWIFPGQLL